MIHSETWFEIFSDPAHIKAELAWTLIQDGLIVFLLWGKIGKRLIKVVSRYVHKDIDESHGYSHEESR